MKGSFQALAVMVTVLATAATAGAGVTSTIYGYIKLDASYDTAMTNDGDYVYVVLPYAEGEEDDEFNMTAKQTRLGIMFKGPEADNVDLSGRIEFDFYGGGADFTPAENKPVPMLRHAYLTMKFPFVEVLAGQTSDVISPIVPTTLNYIVLWKSGDIGYRRPQVRLTKIMEMGSSKVGLAVSANRSMGRDTNGGETVGMPSFQGRLAFGTQIMGQPMELGVSGLMGREELAYPYQEVVGPDTLDMLKQFELDQTVMAVDVSLPLGSMLAVKGQYFTGKNLTQYLGGVGQGIAEIPNNELWGVEPTEIDASGWWGQLTVTPNSSWQFNVGAGMDDPEIPADDTAGNKYDKNTTYFGNVIWTVAPGASIGAEYATFETEYLDGESYTDNRVQLSFMYKF